MKVFISADIEGVTGMVAWSQCGRPNSEHFDFRWAREMMTHDVNAAIRGCRAAGATEIVVKDSHGNSKNLLVSDLEDGVSLVSGTGSHVDGMMTGIDDSFDACMLVGYHGMAGTLHGIMEHTISGQVHRMWLNGMPAGEIAMSTGLAGHYGVPLVMVSSDAAGCAEAAALVPGVATAVVKEGYGRYMGKLLHPSVTKGRIEAAAADGLAKRAGISPWMPSPPVQVKIEFNRSEEADIAEKCVGCTRFDAFTVEFIASSYHEAHRAARMMIANASMGASNS